MAKYRYYFDAISRKDMRLQRRIYVDAETLWQARAALKVRFITFLVKRVPVKEVSHE
jgi:hypothetical protein